MNIVDVIKKETEQYRAKTAVTEGGAGISYGRLLDSADALAESLRKQGVSRLHRVALVCEDSVEYIAASLAVLSLSAVLVPVSTDQSEEEIENVIDRIDVDFIIAEPRFRQGGSRDPLPAQGILERELTIARRTARARPKAEYFRLNPAFIRFSSGTTGASKGVVLSHETIIARTDAANRGLNVTAADTVLWVLSMSYHFVVTVLLFLRKGATIRLCGRTFPDSLVEGILRGNGTFIYASPVHYHTLATIDALQGDALRSIRMAIATAMKLPQDVAEKFSAKFNRELNEAYGIIEVGLPFIRTQGGAEKRGSVGKPLPDYEVAIDDRDTDGVGRIRIRGKGMLDAYYDPWQGREDILVDGWFRTGDLGRMDREGFLTIVGRDKEVINFAGMKIFPQEVEAVLDQHPLVQESLVYGVPHPLYGQLPQAKIVLHDGAASPDIDEFRDYCYQRMAQYKVPKDFKVVDRIPRTASGKIRR